MTAELAVVSGLSYACRMRLQMTGSRPVDSDVLVRWSSSSAPARRAAARCRSMGSIAAIARLFARLGGAVGSGQLRLRPITAQVCRRHHDGVNDSGVDGLRFWFAAARVNHGAQCNEPQLGQGVSPERYGRRRGGPGWPGAVMGPVSVMITVCGTTGSDSELLLPQTVIMGSSGASERACRIRWWSARTGRPPAGGGVAAMITVW
jgi:hypothetical protein